MPGIPLGFWSDMPQLRSALLISPLFVLGVAVAFAMGWMFRTTRLGLRLRIVGDSADAARALGLNINLMRLGATMAGSALAGVGGAFLSLGLSRELEREPVVRPRADGRSAGGVRALEPARLLRRLYAVRRCRGAGSIPADGRCDPAYYYLFYAAPFMLTMVILVATVRPGRSLRGMPGELSIAR